MLCKVSHCAGQVLAGARPHQLSSGDWEMGAVISGTKCCQVVGFIHTTGGSFLNIVSLYSCPLKIIATI